MLSNDSSVFKVNKQSVGCNGAQINLEVNFALDQVSDTNGAIF